MTQRPRSTRLRIAVLGAVILSFMGTLVLRLYYLQILVSDTYQAAATANRIRLEPLEPARGRILDRNGETVVRARASHVVSIRRDLLRDNEATLDRLAGLLGLPQEQLESRLADRRALPHAPVPVAQDVPEWTVVYIKEHIDEFPGVEADRRPSRIYPHRALGAHLVGYIGEITAEQLRSPRYRDRKRGACDLPDYRPGSIVGRSGLEHAYETDLRGSVGCVKREVNAAGDVIRQLSTVEPTPGYDVVTTIDLGVQALVEESLMKGIVKARTVFDRESQSKYLAPAGGAVVLDPRNGELLAMASFPSFDPSAFAEGITTADFNALQNDPTKPLLNRVTQAQFPPGSTFKIVTAAAALEEGVATRSGRYECPPSVRFFDQTFHNWRSSHSGRITLSQALIESCNTVFQTFGAEFYRRFDRAEDEQRLQMHARRFGFGRRTGLDLPFEAGGVVPDRDWLKDMHARLPQAFPYSIWLPGYTINMSIGQGDLISTPLQLANAYAAVANGGILWQPRLGLRIIEGDREVRAIEPQELGRVGVGAANLGIVRRGLEGVPVEGTGRGAFSGFPFQTVRVAGKTGTAQLQTIPPKQPYAWFVAYAPVKDPKYVVAVMLEEGGHGGETAAPIVRRILEGLFGLPLSEITPAARTD